MSKSLKWSKSLLSHPGKFNLLPTFCLLETNPPLQEAGRAFLTQDPGFWAHSSVAHSRWPLKKLCSLLHGDRPWYYFSHKHNISQKNDENWSAQWIMLLPKYISLLALERMSPHSPCQHKQGMKQSPRVHATQHGTRQVHQVRKASPQFLCVHLTLVSSQLFRPLCYKWCAYKNHMGKEEKEKRNRMEKRQR